MLVHVNFVTPSELSYLDLVSMGGSEKLGDETKIGQFCSGLKYAIALMLRNDVQFKAVVKGNHFVDGKDRDTVNVFTPFVYVESDELTAKEKNLIGLTQDLSAQCFHSNVCIDEAGGDYPTIEHKTGFSVELGYNWLPWMALREIYSNMLDEGGYYTEEEVNVKSGTVITLSFEEDSVFGEVWKNRHLYINESKDTFEVDYNVKAIKNEEEYIRIYKQDILVYEDKDVFSEYSYIISFGEIDERRILSDYSSVRRDIVNAIKNCENEDFLRGLFRENFLPVDRAFINGGYMYGQASATMLKLVAENMELYGSPNTYDCFVEAAKKRDDCNLPGKTITTIEDSLWSYSKNVTIEETPQESEKSISVLIASKYDLDLSEISIKESKLTNAKVVADKFNKCLILSPDFDLEKDMADFVVEYYTLSSRGNIILALSKALVEKLKRS